MRYFFSKILGCYMVSKDIDFCHSVQRTKSTDIKQRTQTCKMNSVVRKFLIIQIVKSTEKTCLIPFNLSSLVMILKTCLNSCRMIPVIPT